MSYFARKQNRWFYMRRRKMLSTENNVRPNRDDRDHVLFTTIDLDSVYVH
jgi:hypothetical protein